MVLNNKLLNNIKESLYYANHEKHTKQKKVLFVKKFLESVQQQRNRLKKIYKTIRQKNAYKKKAIKRRDKRRNKP